MITNFNYDRHSLPVIARAKRVSRRFATQFGTRGLSNTRYMTGKQTAAYGRELRRDYRALRAA